MKHFNKALTRARQTQSGFTLLEIMGGHRDPWCPCTMIVPQVIGNKEKADVQKAVSDIVSLENALDMYRLDNNHYQPPSKV